MTRRTRKFFAILLLILLLVVPFMNWKLGALFWMCAWLVYIFQGLFSRHSWKLGEDDDQEGEAE